MDAARLFAAVSGLRLPDAASLFSAAGVPVFPCVPGGKRPLVKHGFQDATSDARQVALWWERWPAANIGMPTGVASGVEVVDVDRKPGGSGFASFEHARRANVIGGWSALVRTPSGGLHAYFPVDLGRRQSSWQAAGACIDFRGAGGYVIVPPSELRITEERHVRYTLIGGPDRAPRSVDAMALRSLLDPRPEVSPRREAGVQLADAGRLARWVAALNQGERNHGLFWAACRLAEGGQSAADTLEALAPAAESVGLAPREVVATIRSAYRTTSRTPSRSSGQAKPPQQPVHVVSQVLS
jgi:hypothetical protein